MKIAPDIIDALGPELLRNGLKLGSASVEETLARLRQPRPQPDAEHSAVDIEDVLLDGGLRLRICAPRGDPPAGILVNIHGGGWVAGSIENDHARCAAISAAAGCVTVSVGYRLAPEAPFPAAVEDCATALAWVSSRTGEFSVPDGSVAVMGSSAGANLAVAAQLRLAERGDQRLPKRQILLYPMCDSRPDHPSCRENARGFFLSSEDVAWYWDRYADEAARASPFASILRADDLSRLPPGLMITSELDPLRDEGEALAANFRDDGVQLNCVRYIGAIHGFVSLAPDCEATKLAMDQIRREIRMAFSI
jgi:acetyl esterase